MTSQYTDEQMSEMFLKEGINQIEIEEYESAIKGFTNSINKNPQNFTAYLYRGKTKSVLKDYTGAIEDYSKALELNPELVNAFVERGFAKDDTSDYLGAIADLRKAVEIDPNHEHANLWLGVIMKNNKIDGSEFYLKKAANLGNEEAVKFLEQNERSAMEPLKGQDLLDKIKQLGNMAKTEIVRECGYVFINEGGTESPDLGTFYEALLEAKGIKLSTSTTDSGTNSQTAEESSI